MDDVQRLSGEVVERLAAVAPDERPFRFDAASVPMLPPSASTGSIVITRGQHEYNSCWRADSLHLYATGTILRGLGVLVLASLFAEPDSGTDLALTHPASTIRTLRIRAPRQRGWPLALAPLSYTYSCQQPGRHPWYGDGVDPRDLPAVYLTDHRELGGVTDAEWQARDTVVGFGTQHGVGRFGQFLLDIGAPDATGDEYHLEGEAGYRGVAPMSAELNVWLPGSFGWWPEYGLD
ncbi:MAG: hypothetical protein WCA46_27315 [Actinocatenispora sp.]